MQNGGVVMGNERSFFIFSAGRGESVAVYIDDKMLDSHTNDDI